MKKKITYISIVIIIVVILVSVRIILERSRGNYKNQVQFDGNIESGEYLESDKVSQNNDEQLNQSESGFENIDTEIISIPGIKKLGNIEISDIRIKLLERDKCEITADLKNTTEEFIESKNVIIKAINESGDAYVTFSGLMTSLIAFEPSTFTARVLADITDASDLEFSYDE